MTLVDGVFATYPWLIWLISIGGAFLVIAITGLILSYKYKAKRVNAKPKKNVDIIENNSWINYLGGSANIVSVEAKGSRLIVKLANYDLVNNKGLHELGATSVIKSEDKITIVCPESAEKVAKLIK